MARTLTPNDKPKDTRPVLQHSDGFPDWLEAQDCSLAVTTYQAGRLILIGRKPDGSLRGHERLIEQCQGLWSDGQTLWASGLHALWRFGNDIPAGQQTPAGVDRLFVPRESRVTGRIDVHDIAIGDPAQFGGTPGPAPVFISSAFSCLATFSENASFQPLWRPPFVTAVVGEDRCHLNGLAMDGNRAAYVSLVAKSDVTGGWRDHRRDGGMVLDVATGEPVTTGLSMPHSPRLFDGRLWVLNSGRGEVCTIDPQTGAVTSVASCPGYARGLGFVGRHAVIGLSRPRGNALFEGLDLDDQLNATETQPMCGLQIVNIDTGQTVHWMSFAHTIEELYDVAILPGVRQPEAIGFLGEDIERHVTVASPV